VCVHVCVGVCVGGCVCVCVCVCVHITRVQSLGPQPRFINRKSWRNKGGLLENGALMV